MPSIAHPLRRTAARNHRVGGRWAGVNLRAGLAFFVAALAMHPRSDALAQAVPAAKGSSFTLSQVVFRNVASENDAALNELAAAYIGKTVTLSDLEKLSADVTRHYRAQGYFLAQAFTPQQTILDGRVEITVLEGRLGKIELQLAEKAPITESRIRAVLAALPVGGALREASYERTMLLLSDLPGLRVQAGLKEGAETGTTDLVVEVGAADRRWQASVSADNFGTESIGHDRLIATARYLSPLSIGDNLDARLMVTSNGRQTFGRLAYEAPIDATGWRVGASASRVTYSLGATYDGLGATGTAEVYEASLLYPIVRSRARNLFLRASIGSKGLRDENQAFGVDNQKSVGIASVSLSGEARDNLLGGGYVGGSVTLSRGTLRFQNQDARDVDQSDFGHRTAGSYSKMNLQLSRLQTLFGRNTLHGSINAQFAGRNLDPSEKLALGGDGAVRAYPAGEVVVDTGWIATVEWRYSITSALVVTTFYDSAQGQQAKNPNVLDTANTRRLRGPGIGVNWNAPYECTVLGSLAWPTSGRPSSDGRSGPRLLVQLQKAF